jgi:hypothetical protein
MKRRIGKFCGAVSMWAIGVVWLLGVARPSEALVNSCSVSGEYVMSGSALGDSQVLGFLVFSPNGTCTSGTFTGSVAVKQNGNPAFNFTPTGTYVVNSDTTMSITTTGGVAITLNGIVSGVVGDLGIANLIHAVGDVGGAVKASPIPRRYETNPHGDTSPSRAWRTIPATTTLSVAK